MATTTEPCEGPARSGNRTTAPVGIDAAHDVVPSGPPRGTTVLLALLAVAVAVSVVHYVDNTVNYADYPQPTSGPAPSQTLVAVSWFVFTAFGAAGMALFLRRRFSAAAICLAVYAGSGLVGIGHYTVAGATSMPWWRQAHVIADISCGVAVLAFAVWTARQVRGSGRGTRAR